METQERLINFEKYLKKNLVGLTVKSKIINRFHEVFKEEMIGTETGDKFREKEEKYWGKFKEKEYEFEMEKEK